MLSTVRPLLLALTLVLLTGAFAQQPPIGDFTGMYSFIRDGEYVQLTLDPAPTPETDWSKPMNVTGFISRYGSSDTDKDQFLDHFFKSGSLAGNKIKFVTRAVHGTWFEFEGEIKRGEAPSWAKDGYYVVAGRLTEHTTEKGKARVRSREITMKSFANLDEEQN